MLKIKILLCHITCIPLLHVRRDYIDPDPVLVGKAPTLPPPPASDDDGQILLYFFAEGRKKYAVYWKKGGEKIGKLYVKATLPQDHVIYKLPRLGRGKFRFRFDSYITTHGYDSHSLVIHDFTANEVADYTISVVVGRQSLSRSVMLRHFGKIFFLNFTSKC